MNGLLLKLEYWVAVKKRDENKGRQWSHIVEGVRPLTESLFFCPFLNLQINPTFVYYLQGPCGPKLIAPHLRTR